MPWSWRSMRSRDLDRVVPLADALFPDHPEDAARFAERLERGGDLCLALGDDNGGIGGYAVAYPWPLGPAPPLNRPLVPPPAGASRAVYLHDLAVHPSLSGAGHAGAGLALLVERARAAGFDAIALVAVNDSAGFWQARGFAVPTATGARSPKPAGYGADARYMVRTL